MAAPRSQPHAAAPLTVSQAAAMIRTAIADGTPSRVRVVGEVSNFSDRNHWFFSLKDEQACLRCVCFASSVRRIDCPVRDGMEVVVSGRIDFYDAQGHVQLYIDRVEPVGAGALELRLRQLMAELREAGYFDPSRKRPLPLMARRIAVVTSRSAAALQDVIDTACRRWPGCRLLLFDVRVQGGEAAGEIAAAVEALSRHGRSAGVDAILLTRGGGSIEDLWAFNERVVADAIYRCELPVVAAIGHETDTTIAELVADLRCATPTQAAMALVPDGQTLRQQVDQVDRRLALLTRRLIERGQQRLTAASRHTMFRRPASMLDAVRHRLDTLESRLTPAMPRRLDRERRRVDALQRQLQAIGPDSVLARGYSYTLGPDGRVLRRPDQVAAGERITSVLHEGRLTSRVEGDDAADGEAPKHRTASKQSQTSAKRKAKIPSDGGEPRLF